MERLPKNIATIKAGYSFRGSIPTNENGNYQTIQIKDINHDAFVSSNCLLRTEIDSIKPKYLAGESDVLFTSRGANRRAGVAGAPSANAAFVSQLYALKIKTADISPKYLAWYINQPPAQEFLEANASGSYIRNIKHDVLAELPVILPSPDAQRKIIEIHHLGLRERELAKRILVKREQVTTNALLAFMKQQK